MSLFSGSLFTLPDVVDPIQEISHFETLANNMVCLITVFVMFLIYILLLVWSKYQDKKDVSRVLIIILNN